MNQQLWNIGKKKGLLTNKDKKNIEDTVFFYKKLDIKSILEDIYSDIWTNCYMTNCDQSDSGGTTNKMSLYISRNYTLINNGNIGFYSYYTLNYPDTYLEMELSSLNSRQNFCKIIKTDDVDFWKSKDTLMMADNIMTYQINNEYGIKVGYGGDVNLGGWVKKCYSCWIPKTDDIQVNKYGDVFPTFIENTEINGIIYKNVGDLPYKYRGIESQNLLAYGAFKNGCTIGHMRFLARVYKYNKIDKYLNSFMNGLNFIFNIYEHQGTFLYKPDDPGRMLPLNDGHFSNVCLLLIDISNNSNNEYSFITTEDKNKCINILNESINFLLQLQIKDQITGKKTIWAQQYGNIDGDIIQDDLLPLKNPKLLAPKKARAFEPLGLAGGESQSVLHLLMNISNPSIELINSVISAIEFYLENAIYKKIYRGNKIGMDYDTNKYDLYLLNHINKKQKPIWARLYNILSEKDHKIFLDGIIKYENDNDKFDKIAEDIGHGTSKFYEKYFIRYQENSFKLTPLFGDMDNSEKEDFNKLSYERRTGYAWFGSWPIFCIKKYLDWISNNLFSINNPNSDLIDIIINCVEKIIKCIEDTEYKFYTDERFNNFKGEYLLWCNNLNIKPTKFIYEKIKIGFIGLGPRMRYLYQELFKNNNNFEMISICDIQNSRIEEFKKINNYDNKMKIYKDYNEMLDKENLDAIMISLMHHNNGFVTNKCIDKGIKYIYEEKPFFWNINEGYNLVNKIINNNIINQIGSQTQSHQTSMNGVRLIRNNGIGDINNIDFLIPWYPSKIYFNQQNDKIENNNLTHDLFNNWLYPNSNYVSNNSDNFKNILIKNNNNILSSNWRDTIEYGGGLATAIGLHWWGFLFKCLNINYDDYPTFNFIPSESEKYLVKIEIDCPKKLKNKININYGFVENNQDQEMKFYGSNDKWMKFNFISRVTTNVNIEEIISNDTTLDYKFYNLWTDEGTDTEFHINNWIKSIKYGIKPNFPVEEAFYPTSICLVINALYNIDFNNNILWNTKNNIFDTNNNKFKELINWKMYDIPETKVNKIIKEKNNNFNINSLGNCVFNNENYLLTFSILENDNKNIYLAKSTDKNNWNYSKLINDGSKPFTIEFNNTFYIYYIDVNNKLSGYNTNNFNNLNKIENINLLNNDFTTNSFVIINFDNKLYILYKENLNNIKCAKSDDGINWLESDIVINNDDIKYLSDIKYYNNVYYLSCVCLSTNQLRVNDNQFSTKIFYSYDLENWIDLLNQELILDNFEIDDKVIIANPYNSIDPESSDDIIYKYGCKFLNGTDNDITSNLLLFTKNGIICRHN